ncbi:Uncharacterized protein Adt_20107 [Abeliophyllum distichum]|uniref:Uncharacterized protein n=1 Tax=Abeliophyllum distichum TaxID=126358 RepID=A0ABD1SUU3_9LAMI
MDTINILVDNNGETVRILVPDDCSYVQLIDMVMSVFNYDRNKIVIALYYDVGGGLAPIRITNDNAGAVYLRLKSKEQLLTTYLLRVTVTNLLDSIISVESVNNSHDITGDGIDLEHIYNSSIISTDIFACSVYQTIPDVVEDEFEVDNYVSEHGDFDGIDTSMIFRDKKVLKKKICYMPFKTIISILCIDPTKRNMFSSAKIRTACGNLELLK